MEIFQDLFFTISFSLIVSLILAKLFSASASDDDIKCKSSSNAVSSEAMSEAKSVACDFEKLDSGKVQCCEEKSVDYDKFENHELLREFEDVGVDERDTEGSVFEGRERKCECEKAERESVGGDDVIAEQVFDEITERKFSEIEVEPVEGNVVQIVDDDDDDDWEGIERTELEKVFWAAVAFLGSDKSNADRVSMISNEVKMQLYGLNKVATQGPCCETQPMAIKVSARANWNAWKRVGNISPEEAMEQYVALLSQHVPDWMADDSSKNGKTAHLVDGTTGQLPSYLEMHPGSEMKGQPSKECDVHGSVFHFIDWVRRQQFHLPWMRRSWFPGVAFLYCLIVCI